MLNRIKAEPVLITGLVRAVILCLTAFGLRLSADQVAAVMLVTEAVLSLVTRQQVAPSGTPAKNETGALTMRVNIDGRAVQKHLLEARRRGNGRGLLP